MYNASRAVERYISRRRKLIDFREHGERFVFRFASVKRVMRTERRKPRKRERDGKQLITLDADADRPISFFLFMGSPFCPR